MLIFVFKSCKIGQILTNLKGQCLTMSQCVCFMMKKSTGHSVDLLLILVPALIKQIALVCPVFFLSKQYRFY